MLAVLREKISVRLGRGPDGEEGSHFVPACSDDRIRSAQLSALLIPAGQVIVSATSFASNRDEGVTAGRSQIRTIAFA